MPSFADVLQEIGASRRALRVSIDKSMDGNSNKNSLILAHNEVGEQLWLRTFEGNGRYQVSALPPDGTATIKLPISHSNQDYSQKTMLPGRFRKLVAVRIGDAKVRYSAALSALPLKFRIHIFVHLFSYLLELITSI